MARTYLLLSIKQLHPHSRAIGRPSSTRNVLDPRRSFVQRRPQGAVRHLPAGELVVRHGGEIHDRGGIAPASERVLVRLARAVEVDVADLVPQHGRLVDLKVQNVVAVATRRSFRRPPEAMVPIELLLENVLGHAGRASASRAAVADLYHSLVRRSARDARLLGRRRHIGIATDGASVVVELARRQRDPQLVGADEREHRAVGVPLRAERHVRRHELVDVQRRRRLVVDDEDRRARGHQQPHRARATGTQLVRRDAREVRALALTQQRLLERHWLRIVPRVLLTASERARA